MSMDYWPIVGFGVEVDVDTFDKAKLKNAADVIDVENIEDILHFIIYKSPAACDEVCWEDTGKRYEKPLYFVLISAELPWVLSNKEMTKDQAKELVMSVLRPYLREEEEKVLYSSFEYIFEVGCG